MGVNINFVTNPELKKVNPRREGKSDDAILCVDLTVQGLARIGPGGELIVKLLGCDPKHALAFWREPETVAEHEEAKQDGPEVAFNGLDQMTSWAWFPMGHTAVIAGRRYRPKQLAKFKFLPKANYTVFLEFTVTIESPTENDMERFCDALLEGEIACQVQGDPDIMDGQLREASDG